MDPIHWLMRMRRWAQNPPSWQRVLLVTGIVAACLLLVAVETFLGWPAWMTLERVRPPR
jgi:hypothetical protein